MPQMAPISWLLLFIMFFITFIIFNVMNYYCYTPKLISSTKINKTYKVMKWKW